MYARLVFEEVPHIIQTYQHHGVQPTWIYARDSLHDPKSWAAFFKLFVLDRKLTSAEIISFLPLVEANTNSSFSSGQYSIKTTKVKGWVHLTMNLGGEQSHNEFLPTVHELRRMAALYNLTLIPKVYLNSQNLVYSRLTLSKSNPVTILRLITFICQ